MPASMFSSLSLINTFPLGCEDLDKPWKFQPPLVPPPYYYSSPSLAKCGLDILYSYSPSPPPSASLPYPAFSKTNVKRSLENSTLDFSFTNRNPKPRMHSCPPRPGIAGLPCHGLEPLKARYFMPTMSLPPPINLTFRPIQSHSLSPLECLRPLLKDALQILNILKFIFKGSHHLWQESVDSSKSNKTICFLFQMLK